MNDKPYYSSGEFARKANVSIRTIRFYDKINILKPSYINESGARFYSDTDFTRLQQILLLKYLGFSLDDIKNLTIGDSDSHMLLNSLRIQQRLVQDKIEQMQLVAKAIHDTTAAIEENNSVDWSRMLDLIHLTGMENSLKTQYLNANNINARINLHKLYSENKLGWFPWIFNNINFSPGMTILELGCGNGALWTENAERIPDASVTLSDISEGMLRDTRRLITNCGINDFSFNAFDCHSIPYNDDSFDLIIANHLLFYCHDIDKTCSEVQRTLKNGGTFICSTYSSNHMKEINTLIYEFDDRIVLSADKLYEKFGLDNGTGILSKYFNNVKKLIYPDSLNVDAPEPLIEYILSCHGNQNQYLMDRYKDFREYIAKKTKNGLHITKEAGIFICKNTKKTQ